MVACCGMDAAGIRAQISAHPVPCKHCPRSATIFEHYLCVRQFLLALTWAGLQALQETFLVFRLAVLLYSYLGLGTRWTGKLLRLILYSMLLLPGFIQVCAAGLLESEGPPLAPPAVA